MYKIIFIFFCLFWGGFFLIKSFQSPQPEPLLEPLYAELLPIIDANKPQESYFINNRTAGISSVSADIFAKLNNIPFKFKGYLVYQKPKHFKMVLTSFVGKEVELGSNDSIFWFYSRRIDPPYLYYAPYQKADKTRLKSLFHPVWLMESLCLNPISQPIKKTQNYGELLERKETAEGMLLKKTLIDLQKDTILGHYLYKNNTLIASSEIEKYDSNCIPLSIKYIWYEEKQTLCIYLHNIIINKNVPSEVWSIPSHPSCAL